MPLYLGQNRVITCSNNKSNAVPIPQPPPPGTSGPVGAVQLSSGPGGTLTHNSDIYVEASTGYFPSDKLVLESGLLLRQPTGTGAQFEDGTIIYGQHTNTASIDFWGYHANQWVSLTTAIGQPSVAAGDIHQIQLNGSGPNGTLAASQDFTFQIGSPNIFTTNSRVAMTDNVNGTSEFLINNANAAGIKLKSTRDIEIVGTSGGAITMATGGAANIDIGTATTGNLSLNQTTGAVTLGSASTATLQLDTAGGDMVLNTSGNGQITLTTPGTGPISLVAAGGDISLQTTSSIGPATSITLQSNFPNRDITFQSDAVILKNHNSTTSRLELQGTTSNLIQYSASSGFLLINNTSNTGGQVHLVGPTGNDNIILNGTTGTLELGAAGSRGTLYIKNLPLGISNTVVELGVDSSNESGTIKVSQQPSTGSAVTAVEITGSDASITAGATSLPGNISIYDGTNTQPSIKLTGSTGTAAVGTVEITNSTATTTLEQSTGTTFRMSSTSTPSTFEFGNPATNPQNINAGKVTCWPSTKQFFSRAAAAANSVGSSATAQITFSSVASSLPSYASTDLINNSNQLDLTESGIYTINIVGVWSADAWGTSYSASSQPIIWMTGTSTLGSGTEIVHISSSAKFPSTPGRQQTFNWCGYMGDSSASSPTTDHKSPYQLFIYNAHSTNTANFTGKIQIWKIC